MSAQTSDVPPKGAYAGFFSSVSSFNLPMGTRFDSSGARGYYIDMSVKADTPHWYGESAHLHVVATQWALGCFERYVAGDGEAWLAAATERAQALIDEQQADGPQVGGFVHGEPLAHTFALRAPWLSAMAQGEAASLFVRVFKETGEERFAEAARRALLPMGVDSSAGGVRAWLDGRAFPEEYPSQPPSFVLNGAIFALWGIHDVGAALGDAEAGAAFDEAVDMLAQNLHRWDVGYWSRYDLYPHPVLDVTSSFYHDLHVNQLRAMHRLVGRGEFAEMADRWAAYATSAWCRRRAFVRKSLFRVAVPRSPKLAQLLPWSPLRNA
jgi:heparosan-N-sulfate-glucuronate 5-epimerase